MISTGEMLFENIRHELTAQHAEITSGKMMSAPAIKYKNKVFAFYYGETMVFRLGRTYDIGAVGIEDYNLLAPFKTKPPMQDWFQIPYREHSHWIYLADEALGIMRVQID